MGHAVLTILTVAPLPPELSEPIRDVIARWKGADSASGSAAVSSAVAARWMTIDEAGSPETLANSGQFIWLVAADAAEARDLDEWVEQLARRHVPALLSTPGMREKPGEEVYETVTAAPLEAAVDELTVLLRATARQAQVLGALQQQMDMVTAQHTGACQQIDRLDEELRLAAQLQREFMPASLPHIHDIHFAAMYRPASYVSGDVYDVQRLDEHHVGLFLGDAVGHGVPAALMTVLLLEAMRTHAKQIDPSAPRGYRLSRPDEVLTAINATMLAQQAGRVRTATACYGLLNCCSRQLLLARAGHPAPMLIEPDGTMTPLQPEGSLFGVFEDPDFEVMTLRLREGQRLLLYSDGFEVAFRGEPGSEQASHVANPDFADEFALLARGPMHEALLHMAGTLDQQAGSLNQADDLTAVLIGVGSAGTTTSDASGSGEHRIQTLA